MELNKITKELIIKKIQVEKMNQFSDHLQKRLDYFSDVRKFSNDLIPFCEEDHRSPAKYKN